MSRFRLYRRAIFARILTPTPIQEEAMKRNHVTGIWERLTSSLTSRSRGPTDDGGAGAMRYDKIGVPASEGGPGANFYRADEHSAAATRAAFSQHISH
jgi:hypothetical protein